MSTELSSKLEEVKLSADQEAAFRLIESVRFGGCVFCTGRAGTGKSTLLREFRRREPCVVLAPTGIAAVQIGGQTIHSFFGMRPGDSTARIPERSERVLEKIDYVVIDEVSMVRADLLDAIDRALRKHLKTDRAFGGKGIALFGDVWQIEPVVSSDAERAMIADKYRSPFFFDSEVYLASDAREFELRHAFRQETDPNFRDALDRVREGQCENLEVFNTRAGLGAPESVLRLTMTNAAARTINEMRLSRLEGEARTFQGRLIGDFGRELPTEQELRLKVGARVMLLANRFLDGYVNGDLGTVYHMSAGEVQVELDRGEHVNVAPYTWERLEFEWIEGEGLVGAPTATFEQLPLKLAWATTVHKAQGQTFDVLHLELERRAFAHGQTYVALSRCRTLAGLTLRRSLFPGDVICRERVRDWCGGWR